MRSIVFFLFLPLLAVCNTCQLSLETMQGKGVGFDRGYSTLALYYSSNQCYWNSWIPYFDLRGHLSNQGKPAANAGVGLRYLAPISFGANAYYDFRKTKHARFNQVGAGLEVIGDFWSFILNGYLPVGPKRLYKNRVISIETATNSPPFFSGNNLFLEGFTSFSYFSSLRKYEFALGGLDGSARFGLYKNELISVEFAVGPYYYQGAFDSWIAGGRGEMTAYLSDYVTLSGEFSYDNHFHWRGAGEVAINIPFGPKSRTQCKESPSIYVDSQFSRGAHRNEMIVTERKQFSEARSSLFGAGGAIAINPATGLPWIFWFVNNLSHSDGTFESPFPTLAEAIAASGPNDAIYIYPGDGTSTGLDAGSARFTMQTGQSWLGAGIAQTIQTQNGPVIIPAQASGMPVLTSDPDTFVINLADDCTISGLHIVNNLTTTGTVGNPISTNPAGIGSVYSTNTAALTPTTSNPTIINNLIECTGPFARGIYLYNTTGTMLFDNNQFTAAITMGNEAVKESRLIHFNTYVDGLTGAITLTNNTFTGTDTSATATGGSRTVNLDLIQGNGCNYTLAASNNNFALTGTGVQLLCTSRLTNTFSGTVENNVSTNGYQGITFQALDSALGDYACQNNMITGFSTSQGSGVRGTSSTSTSLLTLSVLNNMISGIGPNDNSPVNVISINQFGSPMPPNGSCVRILDNTFGVSEEISFNGIVRYEPLVGNTNNTPTSFAGPPVMVPANTCGTIP